MSLKQLENLEKIGSIKPEPFNEQEYKGLIQSGEARLKDALNTTLSIESRFDLAYNAAHSFALAALRQQGYRSINRYIVFQTLPITLGSSQEITRTLDHCHNRRNISEYEGYFDVDIKLLEALINAARYLFNELAKIKE
jgi:hypothetical protein